MISRLAAWPLIALLCNVSADVRPQSDPARAEWEELSRGVVATYRRGEREESLVLAQQAYQFARQRLGQKDPDTLESLNDLAFLYHSMGRYSEAGPLFEKALRLREAVLGPQHPDTVRSLNNLAALYRAEGRYAEAEPLYAKALNVSKEVLGPRHPDTLASMAKLGLIYQELGRYAEAEPLQGKALRLSEQILGEKDPQTLLCLGNLAALYQAEGRYADAEPLYRKLLPLSDEVLGPAHPQTLAGLNNLAALYKQEGRYSEAEPLYKQVLRYSRQTLGATHAQTLAALNNLGALYRAEGRYAEAEPLYQEALRLSEQVLGTEHPATLTSLNNLALLYQVRGLYGQAEPLFQKALKLSQQVLGPAHPDTLITLNNLGLLYQDQGRYGKAEQLYETALQHSEQTADDAHPRTLTALNNLAELYRVEGRYAEAEPLYRKVLDVSEKRLGAAHPDTIGTLNNLALLYHAQGRYGQAEPLFRRALDLSQQVLGPNHPDTIGSLNNLGFLYYAQGRYAEAEPLFERALHLSEKVLGSGHYEAIGSLNNLASAKRAQGSYRAAEVLYDRAVKRSEKTLGPQHPDTLTIRLNRAALFAARGNPGRAVETLRQAEADLLGWLWSELYAIESDRGRRRTLASRMSLQEAALSLAAQYPCAETAGLAADVMLRWKQMRGEEDAFLAALVQHAENARVGALGQAVADARSGVAARYRAGKLTADDVAVLEEKEYALAEVSQRYKDHLEVRKAGLGQVRAALPPGGLLVEFRQYHPVDFGTGRLARPRWAAVAIDGDGAPVFRDLGPVAAFPLAENANASQSARGAVLTKPPVVSDARLHQALLGPFEDRIAKASSLYLAPDGALHLVAFHSLKLPDGRYLIERQPVRILTSGRDLLRAEPAAADKLLAIGGVNFDEYGHADREPGGASRAIPRDLHGQLHFQFLRASGEEVERLAALYERMRKAPAEVWQGSEAGEGRLKGLASPPRVLHLATHGFYLADRHAERPLLLGGLALAGANLGLRGELGPDQEDGILYGLEAASLELLGTELVVLAACETGQGAVDYTEGVEGLVRALRIAGARDVLMTLWPVDDADARDFMLAFYTHWLGAPTADPATALRATQLGYLKHPVPSKRAPAVWAPYVLVGP